MHVHFTIYNFEPLIIHSVARFFSVQWIQCLNSSIIHTALSPWRYWVCLLAHSIRCLGMKVQILGCCWLVHWGQNGCVVWLILLKPQTQSHSHQVLKQWLILCKNSVWPILTGNKNNQNQGYDYSIRQINGAERERNVSSILWCSVLWWHFYCIMSQMIRA